MKKCRRIFVTMMLLFGITLLQGCSPSDFSVSKLTTPTTTHEVIKDKYNEKKFEVALTADMTQNYEWYIYSKGEIDMTGEKYRKGMFNDTYYWNYAYIVNDENDFPFYLILVKDGDLEGCRAFPYNVRMKDSKVIISEDKAISLKEGDPDLYKEISENLTLTTSY